MVSTRTADEAQLMLASRELDAAIADTSVAGLDPDKLAHYLRSRDPLLADQTLILGDDDGGDVDAIVDRLATLLA